jgi:hypothetical protein
MFRFSETESFDLSSALHAELGADGWWYAVGDGLLVPCESKEEAERLIATRRNLKSARSIHRQAVDEPTLSIGFNFQDDKRGCRSQSEEGSDYELAVAMTPLRRLMSTSS